MFVRVPYYLVYFKNSITRLRKMHSWVVTKITVGLDQTAVYDTTYCYRFKKLWNKINSESVTSFFAWHVYFITNNVVQEVYLSSCVHLTLNVDHGQVRCDIKIPSSSFIKFFPQGMFIDITWTRTLQYKICLIYEWCWLKIDKVLTIILRITNFDTLFNIAMNLFGNTKIYRT